MLVAPEFFGRHDDSLETIFLLDCLYIVYAIPNLTNILISCTMYNVYIRALVWIVHHKTLPTANRNGVSV